MKYLPLLLLLVCTVQTSGTSVFATPTQESVYAAPPARTQLDRAGWRAARKQQRRQWRTARKAGADPTTEQRLARRSSLALFFSIISIPLTLFTAGLILFGTMGYTRKVLTDYIYHPEVKVGYQRARVARFIAVGLTGVICLYLVAAFVSILTFL